MVDIYIDDSDTINRTGIVCLACVAAPRDVWNHDFVRAWTEVGQKHHLPGNALHTSDFLSGRAEYALLAHTDAQRTAILLDYMDVIHKCIPMAVCVSVDSEALAAVLKSAGRHRVAAHVFCLLKVFQLLHKNMRKVINTQDYTVSTCCDFGDSSTHMLTAFRKLRQNVKVVERDFTAIGFADDRTYPPLQLADFFACLALREIRLIGTTQTYPYGSLDSLISARKTPNSVFNILQLHIYKSYIEANAELIRSEMEQAYL